MITEKDMESAIEFGEMLEQIKALYVPGQTYFVAWGDEDYKVVAEGCRRHKLENPVLPEDYLDLAAAYKLLKEEQNVDTGGLWHTAYDDAANTGKLLVKLLADGWKPEAYWDEAAELHK